MAARPFSAPAIIPEFLGRRVRSRGGCWSKLRRDAELTLHHYGTGERSATQFRKFLGESKRTNSLKTNRLLPVDALRFGTRCAHRSGGRKGCPQTEGQAFSGLAEHDSQKPLRVLHFREAQEIQGCQVLIGIADKKGQPGDAGKPRSKGGADRGGV